MALVCLLCLALATATEADSLKTAADTLIVLAIVGVAAIAVVAVVVVQHAANNRTVTGCVATAPNGLTLTDEKDKRIYILTGDTTGAKPAERMKLQLKKVKTKNTPNVTWALSKVAKDFGACQP
jgi:copper(I)-binding protein